MALILAVDPEQRQQAALACLARELNGHELLSAASCADALKALDRRTPDLVLLPALLPEAEESELLSNLRSRTGSDVQALTMPQLKLPDAAPPPPQSSVHPAWLNQILHPQDDATEQAGEECEPAVFADLIRSYLWPVQDEEAVAASRSRTRPRPPPKNDGRNWSPPRAPRSRGSGIVVNAGTIARLRLRSARRPWTCRCRCLRRRQHRAGAGARDECPCPWPCRRARRRPIAIPAEYVEEIGGVSAGGCDLFEPSQPVETFESFRKRKRSGRRRPGRIAFLKTLKDDKEARGARLPGSDDCAMAAEGRRRRRRADAGRDGPRVLAEDELGTEGWYRRARVAPERFPGPGGRSGDGVDSADGDAADRDASRGLQVSREGTHDRDGHHAGRTASELIDWSAKTVGRLQVNTEPAGAHVLVDNVPRGVTPLTLDDVAARRAHRRAPERQRLNEAVGDDQER